MVIYKGNEDEGDDFFFFNSPRVVKKSTRV